MPSGPGSSSAGIVTEVLSFLLHAAPFAGVALGYAFIARFGGLRPVLVREPYELDARLLSVKGALGSLPLSTIVANAHGPALDLFCGAVYLCYLFEVFGVAAYLFFRARPRMLELSLGFLLVNLLGWAIWVLYPTAPPWYVDAHGFAAPAHTVASNAAALERVDAWLGIEYFRTFYAKSRWVFGSFPSLHVAYATLVALVTGELGGKLARIAALYAVAIAYAAVYLRHHYVIDVLGGALLALFVWGALRLAARRHLEARSA
ncbi:MAG TPA: phosphatase PAP2 family protein [Polyangiaceae bacterium]|nr:phosphatase PAP2 family protein [Polyangiaceae bacterium]